MSADFTSPREVTARTTHRCEECGRRIDPRETYIRTAGKWEGEFYTNVACSHCAVARSWLGTIDKNYLFETFYGGLWDCVAETKDELDGEERARIQMLWTALTSQWRDESGTLMPTPTFLVGVP